MPLTPQDIVRKEFREAFRGYNQTDVDLFLDEVVEELTRLADENQKMRVRLAALQQELGRFRETRSVRAQQQMASRYADLATEEKAPEPTPQPQAPPERSTPAVPPLRSDPPPQPRRAIEERAPAASDRPDPFAPRTERPAAPPPAEPPRPSEPRPGEGFRTSEPRPGEPSPRVAEVPPRAADPFSRPEQPGAPRSPEQPPRPREDLPEQSSEPRTEPTEPVTERWKPPEEGGSFWDR